jgi:hypothetical protein
VKAAAFRFGIRALARTVSGLGRRHGLKAGLQILLLLVLFAPKNSFGANTIIKTNYHGWPDSYILSNGRVEAVVVPAIGRVMQFRFGGEETGPFFENRAMDGKHPIPTSREWGNFGGDKTWPSPQEDWPKITPRGWPPPVAFDSMPVEARVEGDSIRLISAVDPDYGIRAERVIFLDQSWARMTITTTYYKTKGEPRKVGVWIITQLNEPEDVCIQHPRQWVKQSSELPLGFKEPQNDFGPIHLKRDPVKSTKIGTQADSLLWSNKKWVLEIKSARIAGEEYPDKGSSAEVYTNPNPLTYVELEMLGPVKTLKVGDSIAQTNTYTLGNRTMNFGEAEETK